MVIERKMTTTAGELPHIASGHAEYSGNAEWLTNKHEDDPIWLAPFKLYRGRPMGSEDYPENALSQYGYVGIYRIVPLGDDNG